MRRSCESCKNTCCDNMKITVRKEHQDKVSDPAKMGIGTWLFAAGIIWVKKKNEKWKCRAFDTKTKLCRIYKYRPPLCRGFQCKFAKRRINKQPINYHDVAGDRIYILTFTMKHNG